MNRIASVMNIHFRDRWTWLIVPWGFVLFSSFIVNFIISFFLPEPLYSGGLSSIYIFALVAGMLILPQTFPFTIGLSVRRTDYFLGTTAAVAANNAIISIVLFVLSMAERNWTAGWGTGLHFFHLPYVHDGSPAEQLAMSFAVLMHLFFLGFVVSSVHRRFGAIGLYTFFAVLLAFLTVAGFLCTYYEWWVGIFGWLAEHSAFELAMWTVPVTALYVLASYLLLRKATV